MGAYTAPILFSSARVQAICLSIKMKVGRPLMVPADDKVDQLIEYIAIC